NISYAIGESAAWMPNSKWCVSLISSALVIGLGWTAVRGLALGKWVHNIGGLVMLLVYAALIALPFIGLARGELRQYQPLQIAAAGIILMTVRTISSTSVHFTGTSRLPMVAGWDQLLPVWFTRLHPKYKTPINSVVFVGIITLVIAISSQIGAGIQEAFQLV